MSSIPEELRYTKESEWIRMDDDFTGTCGITDHAQEMLTDIVFVELPDVASKWHREYRGRRIGKGVERLRARFRKNRRSHPALEDSPELNSDPMATGGSTKLR